MKVLLTFAMMLTLSFGLSCPVFGQDPPEDPFGGGFPVNYSDEIFTMGIRADSLHVCGLDWVTQIDSILLRGERSIPESYRCLNNRDMAAADFNGDFIDEVVMVWDRPDGGLFVGIPTVSPEFLEPVTDAWRVPIDPGDPGITYATDTLADILGEIRVVTGNFYEDRPREFVLAYLGVDSMVHLSVYDVDTTTTIPIEMASISDQPLNTSVPQSARYDKISRFDITTGDFNGDNLDEIVLVVNDPDQSPDTKIVVAVYRYDTLSSTIIPMSNLPFTAGSGDYTVLRRLLVTSGNFDKDPRDELAVMDKWSDPDDSVDVSSLHILKLSSTLDALNIQTEELESISHWENHGLAGAGGFAQSLAQIVYDGDLIVGGHFSIAGGFSANNIARWDGMKWRPLDPLGMNSYVHALAVYNGDLIAGGSFTSAGGVSVNHIAKWDGMKWDPLDPLGLNGGVSALTIYNGDLIAGGLFTSAGGVSVNNIARWDGTDWHPLGSGTNYGVGNLEVYNTSLIVAGSFTTAGGTTANRIAGWNGSNWSALGTGMNDYIEALAVYNGNLIAGGWFTTAGGTNAKYVARWNGSSWYALGSGMNDYVWSLGVDDNYLYAGGEFTTAGGVSASRIARWNGSSWSALGSGIYNPSTRYPSAITQYKNDLIVGGQIWQAAGMFVHNIVRWDGAAWYKLGSNMELPMDITAGNIDTNLPDDSIINDELFITSCRDSLLGSTIYPRQYFKAYSFDTSSVPATLCNIIDTAIIPFIAEEVVLRNLFTGRRNMALGDVTGDGYADLTILSHTGTSYTSTPKINIFQFYRDMNSVCSIDSMVLQVASAFDTSNMIMSELILADLDTSTISLGPPTYFHVDSIVQPLVVLNVPPVHFDVLDDTVWDVSNRYPWPPATGYETYSAYGNRQQFTYSMETEIRKDWGISAGLKVNYEEEGVKVQGHLNAKYGEGFTYARTHKTTLSIENVEVTGDDDRILAAVIGYDIWEYPVYYQGQRLEGGNVIVVDPSNVQKQWLDAKGARSWIIDHEVENVFSYSDYGGLSFNPMVTGGRTIEGITRSMSPTASGWWFLRKEEFDASEYEERLNFGLEVGLTLTLEDSVDFLGAEAKAGIEISVNGTYDQSEVSTYSTTFSTSDSLHVQYGYINSAGANEGNREYTVTPYAYWSRNGALLLDFAAKPKANAPGDPPTWWQNHYSDPDPTFLLPWRLEPEKWGTIADEGRFKTKEIVFIPAKPYPGDTVLIMARVHNFSLNPTPTPVKVSFYLGNPDNGGMTLTDKNTADSIFYACNLDGDPTIIGSQGRAVAKMVWQVPGEGSISGCQRIWAVIDPLDEISPEVHDNDDPLTNNKGWRLLYVNTDNICIDGDGDGWEDPAFRCSTCPHLWDNCPTVANPDQADSDGDGIGNACEEIVYICGDPNGNGAVNILDVTYLIGYLYKGGPAPVSEQAADVNHSGGINILDVTYLINYLYKGGPAPNCP